MQKSARFFAVMPIAFPCLLHAILLITLPSAYLLTPQNNIIYLSREQKMWAISGNKGGIKWILKRKRNNKLDKQEIPYRGC